LAMQGESRLEQIKRCPQTLDEVIHVQSVTPQATSESTARTRRNPSARRLRRDSSTSL
jgi:hypothetical protein